ncbi:hypothetical protein HY411_02445 [Candidatus Gottesmanbacteria bacterium]|nr:hypothetical protein [Candidatus Gottesmanbacteria bacterium]
MTIFPRWMFTGFIGLVAVVLFGLYFYRVKQNTSGAPTITLSSMPSQTRSLVAPQGLVAVKEFVSETKESLQEATYRNPSIRGVALRMEWNDIVSSQNKFHWDPLDQLFANAEANNKFVVLVLVPGYGTPSWAQSGVRTETFSRKYGKGAGVASPLPLPWDETYLSRWFTFLGAVDTRYGSRSSFRMIAAAGPTSVSAEMSLPNTENDLETWLTLGYKPSLYIGAWRQVFAQYANLFPRQFFSLALYPGLPINEAGQRDRSSRADTRQKVIDEGLNYSRQFVLQTSGLHAGNNGRDDEAAGEGAGYEIVRGYYGKVLTGFQLSTSATRNPAKMGDVQDPVHALQLSLEKGLEAGAQYIEVYETDVLNPSMQQVLAQVARQLTQ